MNQFNDVRAFHEAFKQPVRTEPTQPPETEVGLRKALIREEADEVIEAMDEQDIAAVAKELADLLYVTYGAALHYGIPLNEIFHAVHRSNMSKLWSCDVCKGTGAVLQDDALWVSTTTDDCEACGGLGGVVKYREDGKVLKPPTYSPPDLSGLI